MNLFLNSFFFLYIVNYGNVKVIVRFLINFFWRQFVQPGARLKLLIEMERKICERRINKFLSLYQNDLH